MADDPFERLESQVVLDYEKLGRLAASLRDLNRRVVVTIGTFDFVHGGHLRYLWKAKAQGDVLIVGLDSDEAVRRYKGPNRPMVGQDERMEFLLLTQIADFVTLIEDVDDEGVWSYDLLRAVHPHIFVAEEESYSEQQLTDIREFCDDLRILERQATTSSSERIRKAAQATLPQLLRDIALTMEKDGALPNLSVSSFAAPPDLQ